MMIFVFSKFFPLFISSFGVVGSSVSELGVVGSLVSHPGKFTSLQRCEGQHLTSVRTSLEGKYFKTLEEKYRLKKTNE